MASRRHFKDAYSVQWLRCYFEKGNRGKMPLPPFRVDIVGLTYQGVRKGVGVAFSDDVYAPLLNRIDGLEAYLHLSRLDMSSRVAGPLNGIYIFKMASIPIFIKHFDLDQGAIINRRLINSKKI